MATPPRVTIQQASTAIKRLHARHRAADDPYAEELTLDPAEVLAYLRKRGPHYPLAMRAQDTYDAAVLHLWLWWQHQDRERWLFDLPDTLALHLADFGQVFGLGPQGVRDRRDRLHALLDQGAAGRPDEKYTRGLRAGGGAAPAVGAAEWLDRQQPAVLQLAAGALQWWPLVDEETARELVDLRDDVRSGRYGPATWNALGDAAEALACCNVEQARLAGAELLASIGLLEKGRAEAIERAARQHAG